MAKNVHFVADQTPMFFDVRRNTTFHHKGLSAVLVGMSGLYYNAETFQVYE
jgi:hypothetical protein